MIQVSLMLIAMTVGHASTIAGADRSTIIAAVKAELKDPESARFKDIRRITEGKGGYCGWVNARNSYGGYTGFSVFFVSQEEGGKLKVVMLPPELSEPQLCD